MLGTFWRRFVLTVVALGLCRAPGTRGEEAAEQASPLALARVVLFSSSVGYFEHRGEIAGDRQIELTFKTTEINDLLKSLVVQDHGGGLVTAVNYGSPEPLNRTLRTLAVDLTEAPSLAQIFQQLRGQRVQLEAPAVLTGTIVSVESRKLPLADKEVVAVDVVNLRTEQGLESVRLDRIARTRFLDPKVDREFQQALELLAGARTSDHQRIKLDFRGTGQRRISVAYIQEAPVWKTTYRLVLADGERPFLQGWAIVENTTAQDWQDVQLTLISGRPISFLMDLYQPLYLPRPLVTSQQFAQLRPRIYDQDLADREQQVARAADQAGGGRARPSDRALGGYGMSGGGMGGMGGGMRGAAGRSGGGQFGAPRGSADERPGQRPLAIGSGGEESLADGMDLAQGVASAAAGQEVGELFRYVLTSPVTLPRNESAMLPIVNEAVQGEKVAIYNPAVHARHPLAGLRLTNTTALHLLQGPITLFDGGEYAGDARIQDIAPGAARLISYALDLETEIVAESQPEKQEIVALRISRGGLHVKHKATRAVRYLVKNSSSRARQILIEQPIDTEWKVTQPAPAETTRSLRRFAVRSEPGKAVTLLVALERDVREDFVLAALEPGRLKVYLQEESASPALKQALRDAIARQAALAELTSQRAGVERRLTELRGEQAQVRSNLQVLGPFRDVSTKSTTDLRGRYIDKMAELESVLEKESARLADLRQQELAAERELAAFLQSLVVE